MPNCKICGKTVTAGEIIHSACREEKVYQIMGVICDKYCKYPELCRGYGELDKFCDSCEVADMLGCE